MKKNYVGIGCYKPESECIVIMKKAIKDIANKLFYVESNFLSKAMSKIKYSNL